MLTAVDGQSITYDAMGNPTSYYNGNRWAFTWAQGRRLTTASDGTNTISYTYDADGLRTSKTVNGTKHTYYYAGGRLLRETFGSNTLDFFYDSNGNAYALKYNGTLYYYITNLQGDVMSIVDGQGAVVASYNYDPYGNLISDEPAENTVGHLNPLRYRAYYYDSESDLYYLQSRYYDPEVGRFLNADALVSTGQGVLGNNMFAYCGNNPIIFIDPTGYSAEEYIEEIKQAITQASKAFALAAGISQIDSPAPGPADILALSIIGGIVIYCLGSATYDYVTSSNFFASSSMNDATIENGISSIARRYGRLQCKEAASDMAEYLRKNGKKAEIITIMFTGSRGYIWSDAKQMTISENGIHVGILYNGIVFCNVHPMGLPEISWINDFHGIGNKIVAKAPI